MLFIAGMVVLAFFTPAAMAADYPQNGQFIAYYDEDQLAKDTSSEDGGTTNYAGKGVDMAAATPPVVAVTATVTPDPDDWPQFMYDGSNVGYSPCDGLPSDNSSVTTLNIDNPAIGAPNPVVADGHIFLMTGFNGFDEPYSLTHINLTCVDEATQQTEWIFDMPRTQHLGSWASPAYDYDNEYVYAVSDNKVFCIDMGGNEVWSFTTIEDVICNGGPTVTDDYVLCSDWYSNYYCLDKDDGDLNWVFNNTDTTDYDMTYSQSTPAYDPDEGAEGKMYVCGWGYDSNTSFNGALFKVDVATGTEDWYFPVGSQESFCGSAALDENNVYVASYNFNGDGNLYRIGKDYSTVACQPVERTDATPAIDLENDLVYVSGGCGVYAAPGVRCFETDASLTPVWDNYNEDMGGWTCSVTLADGYAFVGKEYGYSPYCYETLYALDALTGDIEWFYPYGGGTAAIANDKIYTVDNMGDVYVFG